jgi:hypothetical protein
LKKLFVMMLLVITVVGIYCATIANAADDTDPNVVTPIVEVQ